MRIRKIEVNIRMPQFNYFKHGLEQLNLPSHKAVKMATTFYNVTIFQRNHLYFMLNK
jgi:hypothetical protein